MDFAEAFTRERRARLAAERMLATKQKELFAANRKLSHHALSLTDEIVQQRGDLETARKEAEELRSQNAEAFDRLGQAQETIGIAQRRLWTSLEAIPDGFSVFDRNHVLVAANSSFLSVFDGLECVRPGISYEEILTLLVEEGIVDTEGKRPAEWQEYMWDRWCSAAPEPRIIRLWNGLSVRLMDRRFDQGDTVGLALNITDTIASENALRKARDKAEAANRAKSAFLARMSHELRTPMNGVVGMAEILADSDLNDEARLCVNTIRSSGEALLSLINDVLDFSKAEVDRLTLVSNPFDLDVMIKDIVTLLGPAAKNRNSELALVYPSDLPTRFTGDGGRIRQVLTNLIGNAVKFTENGHVLVRVDGDAAATKGDFALRIVVEDTGIGIAPEKVDYIFGEFNQVEDQTNRRFEGTGLGLAISKKLVELMGGRIWVDSRLGEGSFFGVDLKLPYTAKAVDPEGNKIKEVEPDHGVDGAELLYFSRRGKVPEAAAATPPVLAQPRREKRNLRVLAAEDNATNRLVFSKLLGNLNLDIEFAENGVVAVEKWETFRPDVIFMDISMPLKDGKEATKDIRQRERETAMQRVPIIALTAHVVAEEVDSILACGLDYVLNKPVRKAEILEQLELLSDERFFPVSRPEFAGSTAGA